MLRRRGQFLADAQIRGWRGRASGSPSATLAMTIVLLAARTRTIDAAWLVDRLGFCPALTALAVLIVTVGALVYFACRDR